MEYRKRNITLYNTQYKKIGQIVVKISVLALNKQCDKLKVLCFKMPKISYCNRYPQAENPPHIHTHLVFADTKSSPKKTKRV